MNHHHSSSSATVHLGIFENRLRNGPELSGGGRSPRMPITDMLLYGSPWIVSVSCPRDFEVDLHCIIHGRRVQYAFRCLLKRISRLSIKFRGLEKTIRMRVLILTRLNNLHILHCAHFIMYYTDAHVIIHILKYINTKLYFIKFINYIPSSLTIIYYWTDAIIF